MSRARFYALGFGALMVFDTLTQVCFKLASTRTGEIVPTLEWLKAAVFTPWTYGAVAGYLATFFIWMTLLRRAPVGPAFAASHLEVVAILIISKAFFHEHISTMQIAGATCIVFGIIFLSISEAKHPGA